VVRNVVSVSDPARWEHVVWVNEGYREVREPPLEYRYTRMDTANPISVREIWVGVRGLVGLLRRERFDLLVAHDRHAHLVGVVASALVRHRLVVMVHLYSGKPRGYRRIFALPHVWTVLLSPAMLRHYGVAAGRLRLRVVPDCCADRYFEFGLPPHREAGQASPLRVCGVGMLVEWKGWHILLDAVDGLGPDERSRLVVEIYGAEGTTPESIAYAEMLRRRVARNPEHPVCFCGQVPDVLERVRTADWFVLPSVNEPCSVALSEALALGRPAIVTRSGGNVDTVVDGFNGLFFEPGDAGGLRECLRRAIAGGAVSADAAAIRESVRSKSASVAGKQLLAVLEEVMGGKREGARA
jgi:glycosyltransferase involved in cell wall biosynthesis